MKLYLYLILFIMHAQEKHNVILTTLANSSLIKHYLVKIQ